MSNISDKLDYLKGTKIQIRQALIDNGAPITEDTTFREYADLINAGR